ncbi:MAG TPA: FAD-dependent monooxygenase [Verrucomicrobiae bacterium]|nr:FAD-dependent monooxygenase [Verrucomicrobiae bacterium]
MSKSVQIIGGGLAGLSLGIALRKSGIPATIIEAGNYPRHRVCGEFINGHGIGVLDGLGLKREFLKAGAVSAESAAFFMGQPGTPPRRLPAPALCLSRFVMDKLLADEFQQLGGELHLGERWQGDSGEGIVRASGRRLQTAENGWRWFGLKAHAKNVLLAADLEMHVGRNGYVGLCRLADNQVNVCGLFRSQAGSGLPQNGFELLRGDPGTALNQRLARAEFDEDSFCSVAGLSLQPQRAAGKPECCVGDALTMIPPVTGNGMSLALESARLAAGPLAAFSRGEMSWTRTREIIARSCDQAFSRRLAWAKWLQTAMFSPIWQKALFLFVSRSDLFWRMAFARTR